MQKYRKSKEDTVGTFCVITLSNYEEIHILHIEVNAVRVIIE